MERDRGPLHTGRSGMSVQAETPLRWENASCAIWKSPGRGRGKQKALRGKQAWYLGGSVCLGRSAEVGSAGKFLSVSEVTDTASV